MQKLVNHLVGSQLARDGRQPANADNAHLARTRLIVRLVKVREGEQGEQYLPIYSWSPFGGSQQWGVLLQTAGNLSTGDMKAVLRAFCGDSHIACT